MISQVISEGRHYQVVTEVTYQKRDDIIITNKNGFIKLNNVNLHQKIKNSVFKLLVEWKDISVDRVTLSNLRSPN